MNMPGPNSQVNMASPSPMVMRLRPEEGSGMKSTVTKYNIADNVKRKRKKGAANPNSEQISQLGAVNRQGMDEVQGFVPGRDYTQHNDEMR